MLQPRQLERAAQRYAQEIATLRDFFAAAGVPLELPESVAIITARLRKDTAFRRDLHSHLMVIQHESGQAGAPELLAMVALAAAGAEAAARADAEDAHELLRCVLSGTAQLAPPATLAPAKRFSHRTAWLTAACPLVLAALGTGTAHLLRRPAAQQQEAPVKTTKPMPVESTPPPPAGLQTPVRDGAPEPSVVHHPTSTPSRIPQPATAPHTPASADNSKQLAREVTQPEPRTVPAGSTYPPVAAAPASQPAGAPKTGAPVIRQGTTPAIPTATLSRRLDARTVPENDPAVDPNSGRPYPRLLRRHPLATPTDDATLLAENTPPPRPGTFVSPTSAGTVRPVSLGTMAANILYSPAPTYPAAAAASHVQGQVTIQAEVDRDGSVASARVVSGPPLLREAALEAVLRWRYRPRVLSGKPVTAAATALVEFELP